jgi:TfoX/Sxy family transcriptional regulator of competence genes
MAAEFPKTDQGLVERIDGLMASRPVRKKKMFGTASWFLESNDQMFAGVWGDGIMVRIGESEVGRIVKAGEASLFDPMGGRPMKEYVLLEAEAIVEDDGLLSWLERGAKFTTTLAPKKRE